MKTSHPFLRLGIVVFLGMTVVAGSPSIVWAQGQPSALTAFVTSQTYSGNLGGVAGADAQCQQLAEAAGLSGQYKAWLSDGTSSPATTFTHSTGPYVRTDGTQIAANWADLIDGELDVPLDRDEHQNVPPNNPGPWTGTNSDGTSEAPNCAGWTDASGEAEDRDGGNHGCTSTNAFQWTSCGEDWCESLRPLYCFEQPTQTSDPTPPQGPTWSAINTGFLRGGDRTVISALAVDPTNPAILYAGTSRKGIFTTTDGGQSWSAINTGLTSLGISELVVDPTNPATLYAGTGEGVFKSTDQGQSWSAINTGLTSLGISELLVDPTNPAILHAGTGEGVFKSTDQGQSWSAINTGLTDLTIWTLAMDPTNPAILYAGTRDGVFTTTDGGQGWSAINTGIDIPATSSTTRDVMALAIDPTDPATLYAGIVYSSLWKTTDRGKTWTVLPGPGDNGGINALAINPTNPAILYAATDPSQLDMRNSYWPGGGVFMTTDGGQTWTAINTGMPDDFPLDVSPLVMDPSNPAVLYVVIDVEGLFTTAGRSQP